VIVCDDEPDVLNLVTFALRGFGFEIVPARTGTELMMKALRDPLASPAVRRPDIVVTDIWMPGATGLDILAALRQVHWRTAVVLMTAYADLSTRARASELGADAFFAKPFDIGELVTAVVSLTPVPSGSRE
jgi:DNA-binding response OmpR family regulator